MIIDQESYERYIGQVDTGVIGLMLANKAYTESLMSLGGFNDSYMEIVNNEDT